MVERIEANTFKRAFWIDIARWLVLLSVTGLNLSLPLSLISRLMHHGAVNPGGEIVSFLFLLACDLYFLPPSLLEPKSVTIAADQIIVCTLLWRAKLSPADIVSFTTPPMLTWALLRTRRCFYLINRGDIKNFDELAGLIREKLNSEQL